MRMLDGLNVIFPEYSIKIPDTNYKPSLGHGVSVAIDPKTGKTRASEYGRYDKSGRGIARRVRVPDFRPAKSFKYSDKELKEYERMVLESYKRNHPQAGNSISTYYYPEVDYNTIVRNMQKAEVQRLPQSYGFFYNGPNCGTYSSDISRGIDVTKGNRYHLPITPNMQGALDFIRDMIRLPAPASANGIINPIYK